MIWGQIVVYSGDTERLAHFLERLLDAEMQREKAEIKLLHQHFTLSIRPGENTVAKGMNMELYLPGEEDLDQLAQRAQFCLYQMKGEGANRSALKIEEDHVLVVDPDGRPWKFTAPKAGVHET